ncbi:arabinan endo-1,5-alpha-L-arabinosidase [Paenibacillus sanguinis]|uniref:arabinan endo-1,5-alpha-L-arabinosidase n=1 Tax=Paenibacillus sanguinis TaxID=225906 RepID=UPI0004774E78|nr:arabinan endo-1,5-alpha-L-arabinosidase [Paenibacillus sanguinis]
MMLLLLLGMGGCSKGHATGVLFPEPPDATAMYDTTVLHNEAKWTVNNAHDPGVIRTDQGCYIFSTDVKVGGEPKPGVMVRKSADLIHWTWVGRALPGIPAEALAWTGATNLWAPDIVYHDGEYRLYYSASTFGSRQSMIGLAVSESIEGPWTDQGVVIKTRADDPLNAIDPNVITDHEGRMWMVYGSFFGGIHIIELDPATGKPKEEGFGKLVAARDMASEDGAVEGPYIIYNEKFKKYYLFVSYDSLFEDYNVRVARSDSITGPYVDYNRREMTDTAFEPQFAVGTKLLGGYKFGEAEGWIAPGHNSVLKERDSYYIVHHARGEADKNWSYLHVRKMLWTEDGWPVVSPERYAGETEQDIPEAMLAGEWERLEHDPFIDGQNESSQLVLLQTGKTEGSRGSGSWSFDGQRTLTLTWEDVEAGAGRVEQVQVVPAWDWERNAGALVYTGLNDEGVAVWAKQISRTNE